MRPAWGAPAKLLHWLVAALIFVQFTLGWLAVTWPRSPTKIDLYVWHKSTGMVILLLVVLRLLWRLGHPAPPLPANTPAWERAAAHASHGLLYGLMLVMPLTGWLNSSASGVPFRIFWRIALPDLVAPDKALARLAAQTHFWLFLAFSILLLLHIGAALWHHYVRRDDLLTRMLPTWKKPQ